MNILSILAECTRREDQHLERFGRWDDDIETPRSVMFDFVAPDEATASSLRDFIDGNRYGEVWSQYAHDEWRVTARIVMPPNSYHVRGVSGLMAVLAAEFGVRYDGWGCFLKKPPNKPQEPPSRDQSNCES